MKLGGKAFILHGVQFYPLNINKLTSKFPSVFKRFAFSKMKNLLFNCL